MHAARSLPELSRIAKIVKWGPCTTLSDVRAFLGTIGVARIFIKDFAKIANPLTHLTKKGVEFFFGFEQIDAQEKLKQALIDSPALRPLDYDSDAPIILAVDTSSIAVGFFLCQAEIENPKIRHYARFGSLTLNDRECYDNTLFCLFILSYLLFLFLSYLTVSHLSY